MDNNNEQSASITTFPNPVSNELHITIGKNWQGKKVTYEVCNMNGQIAIKNETSGSSQTETFNLNKLVPGIYIVRATCNGEMAQQKIVRK